MDTNKFGDVIRHGGIAHNTDLLVVGVEGAQHANQRRGADCAIAHIKTDMGLGGGKADHERHAGAGVGMLGIVDNRVGRRAGRGRFLRVQAMIIDDRLVGGAIFKDHAVAGLIVRADHGGVAQPIVVKVDPGRRRDLRIAQQLAASHHFLRGARFGFDANVVGAGQLGGTIAGWLLGRYPEVVGVIACRITRTKLRFEGKGEGAVSEIGRRWPDDANAPLGNIKNLFHGFITVVIQ